MSTYNEPTRPAEFILSEAEGTLSRETVTVVAGSTGLIPGLVLGKITASGKYAPYDNDNVDGSETAAALLLTAADATADVSVAVLIRLAEVKATSLQWAATVAAGEKTAALADLATHYLIAR